MFTQMWRKAELLFKLNSIQQKYPWQPAAICSLDLHDEKEFLPRADDLFPLSPKSCAFRESCKRYYPNVKFKRIQMIKYNTPTQKGNNRLIRYLISYINDKINKTEHLK